jgi:hypothetical protein
MIGGTLAFAGDDRDLDEQLTAGAQRLREKIGRLTESSTDCS